MTVEWGREEGGRRKGKMRTIKLTEGLSVLEREGMCLSGGVEGSEGACIFKEIYL